MKPEIKQGLLDKVSKVDKECQELGLEVIKSGRVIELKFYILQAARILESLRSAIEEQ